MIELSPSSYENVENYTPFKSHLIKYLKIVKYLADFAQKGLIALPRTSRGKQAFSPSRGYKFLQFLKAPKVQNPWCNIPFCFQLALQTFGIQVPLLEESSDKPWHMVIQFLNCTKQAVYCVYLVST